MKSGESVTAGKIEISGGAQKLLDDFIQLSRRELTAMPPRFEEVVAARSALEAYIAELEKVAEAAEVVDWYVHSPGAIKNELLEAIASVSGVHVNHLLALHDALKAVEHTPETSAVSASPSGGAK